MELKEFSEMVVTPALQKIVEAEVEKSVKTAGREAVLDYLKKLNEEGREAVGKLLSEAGIENQVLSDETVTSYLEEHSEEDMIEIIPDSLKEHIASDYIECNPCTAGDMVNDNLCDSDARDLVTELIDRHW